MRPFPSLRDLTWETPKFRPAPYLRTRCRSAAATLSLQPLGGSMPETPPSLRIPLAPHVHVVPPAPQMRELPPAHEVWGQYIVIDSSNTGHAQIRKHCSQKRRPVSRENFKRRRPAPRDESRSVIALGSSGFGRIAPDWSPFPLGLTPPDRETKQ